MTKLERNIVYSLPLISICFEIVKSFIEADIPIIAFRNYAFFLVILFLIIKYFKWAVQLNVFLIILMVYFLILLIVTDSDFEQFNNFVRFFVAKMLFPLGFILTSSYEHFKTLNKRLLVTNILFVVSIVIFTTFGIGKNPYGGDSGFKAGVFIYSAIYIGSFLLIILPLIYSNLKTNIARNALIVLGVFTLVILVLSVRRSAIVIVFIGAIVYMYYYRSQLSKYLGNALVLVVILFASYPLYKDILNKQLEARSNVFNDRGMTDNLQEETRLKETIAVYNERILNPDLRVLLFGQFLFASAGNYDGGIHKDRPLHLDVNIVLHGAGVIGLSIFLFYFMQIIIKYFSLNTRLDFQHDVNIRAAFIGIYLAHLFLLVSGGLITTTFNLITSLYLGAILGLYRSARAGTLKPLIMDHSASEGSSIKKYPQPSSQKPYIYEVYNSVNSNTK